ncbi:hypothetical protein B0H19DRAFT_1257085 [Mycena capillaripes]|nr:hypothetical protein B0H19DRAFT_1257085 [Mycena capillaripes]
MAQANQEPEIALKLLPICPESFQRYNRLRTIERRPTKYPVSPLSRSFSRDPPLQWSSHRHPEGGLYFEHGEHRVFTDCYLYDDALLGQITCALDELWGRPGVKGLLSTHSSQFDIVLDLMKETPENKECGYYFVDHSERIIFWADVFEMSTLEIWEFVPGIETASHVKMALEIQYWLVDLKREFLVNSFLLHELRDTIIYSIGGGSVSWLVIGPDSDDVLLTLTREMIGDLTSPTRVDMNRGSVVIFARFMKEFARERFYHFHGERTARLNSYESVYGHQRKRSYFVMLISPLLLNAPLHHLRAIEVVNTDKLINYASWHKLIAELRSEWQDLVLYGTLILNTNMAFLAVPATVNSRAGQIASYASVCFGLGSVILSIILLRKYHSETPDVPDDDTASAFFHQYGWTAHGLEPLSIVLSLPYALMVWGMVTFISAFLIMVFETKSIEVRGIMWATIFTVVVAIMGFMWTERHLFWRKMKLTGFKIWDHRKSATKEEEQKLPV